jgi:hypothetical protein
MTAAGLATAATPVLFGQEVAGAAVTSAEDTKALTFISDSGESVTCGVTLNAFHNTDDSSQPKLEWWMGASADGQGCFDDLGVVINATYKDREGVTRTLQYGSDNLTGGWVTGAYSATSVRAQVWWHHCDQLPTATCTVTVTASPK